LLFIPETSFVEDSEHYSVPTFYGEHKYYKNDGQTQKPERCSYWCQDPSILVANE